jgi:hypothetical protein
LLLLLMLLLETVWCKISTFFLAHMLIEVSRRGEKQSKELLKEEDVSFRRWAVGWKNEVSVSQFLIINDA